MVRRLGWLGLVALAASASAPPARAQQRPNPVTINPGAGAGSGINLTIPSYGPTTIYTPPFGGGYGGYGGYVNGVAVVTSGGWGAPVPAYGGYGFGPFGYNYTNASMAIAGMPDPIGQQQNYALANSKYDLQTAQAAKAYAEANFFQQQAMATAIQNAKDAPANPGKFNVRTGSRSRSRAKAASTPTVPMDRLFTTDGGVKWPASTPSGPARDRVDDAVAAIAREAKADGAADVQTVNQARDALYAFGQPALDDVRKNHPASAGELKAFLNNVDAVLIGMAGK